MNLTKQRNKKIRILFFGDIFGEPGIKTVEKYIQTLKEKYKIDFIIAQGENISGRKGLNKTDYLKLSELGINAFTMGNHVWANEEIYELLENENNIIRPLNIDRGYQGSGAKIFKVKNSKLRVISLLGITFNNLLSPWEQESANNFFDAMDSIMEEESVDFNFVDFHAETTSEKNVLGLYLDGVVDAVVGTHTHVQTNDYRILPKGTAYITDVGMVGPMNAAIGANFEEVYKKMRYNSREKFTVSENNTQLNAVIIELNTKRENTIKPINIYNIEI
ncbi:TIGR00282 family metallophosphoesterase [Mycoplasma sp. 1232]|uniref:TIGR00282 family metallophosphoesterase n=1 Tax=unclassified Mycoplasma TaxID=2683645 RepID=UPI002B2600C2|nr:TIGR00282 family metallophosphoesterase [Mycoplasma sp. 1232]MEA4333883.1 TIGR00282 family metallophosphoesterase [Mycoplasma sp. 1232]